MATTAAYSRHPVGYATHQKTLPVTMPTSKPTIYSQPLPRVADTPEYSDSGSSYASSRGGSAGSYSVGSHSSYAGSHHGGDYDSHYSRRGGIDIVDELSDRMNSAFDPIRLDRSLAKQAQTWVTICDQITEFWLTWCRSGELHAKQRELQELQAMAQRRLSRARVNFAEGVEAAKEAKRDIEYTSRKIS
jgi:biogenesis of lysosome-related organelles complex 1 subunit KXD1